MFQSLEEALNSSLSASEVLQTMKEQSQFAIEKLQIGETIRECVNELSEETPVSVILTCLKCLKSHDSTPIPMICIELQNALREQQHHAISSLVHITYSMIMKGSTAGDHLLSLVCIQIEFDVVNPSSELRLV